MWRTCSAVVLHRGELCKVEAKMLTYTLLVSSATGLALLTANVNLQQRD